MLWHPSCVPSANNSTSLVVQLPCHRPARSQPAEPPRIVRLLAQAEQWQRMLDLGEARTRAELAKRAGVSANRVKDLLALLKLDPTILDAIRALPAGAPERLVTERRLRPLTSLPPPRQLREVARLMPGLLRATKAA